MKGEDCLLYNPNSCSRLCWIRLSCGCSSRVPSIRSLLPMNRMPLSLPYFISLYSITECVTWFVKNTLLLPFCSNTLYCTWMFSAPSTNTTPPLPLTSPANSHRCNAQSPPEGTSKGSMYVLRVYAKVMPFSVMFITGWSDVPRI